MASKAQIAIALAARARIVPLRTKADVLAAMHTGGVHENNGRRDGLCYAHRSNGGMQTWKTRPTEFRQPIKYGMHGYGQLTDLNVQGYHAASTCPVDAAIRAHQSQGSAQ